MKFAADENFDNDILRGVLRLNADFDVVRIQDTKVYQADDPTVLEWTAQQKRILLTHDVKTMPKHAYERVVASKPMPGVFVFRDRMPLGAAIEELAITIEASNLDEWQDIIAFFPM